MSTPAITQRVVNQCACGHKGMATVKRYAVVQCSKCGKFWWALQPEAAGPLVTFAWPGPNLSAAELREKERV